MQNKATQKCIEASKFALRSALVEEPCILSVPTNSSNMEWKRQLFGKGNGTGICPAVNGTKTYIPANLNHYPDGDIYPSGGNPGPGVHLYFNHPSGGQPQSLVCWTLPNEVTPTS